MLIINLLDNNIEIHFLKKEVSLYYKNIQLPRAFWNGQNIEQRLVQLLSKEINRSKKIVRLDNEVFLCLSLTSSCVINDTTYQNYYSIFKQCGLKLKGITSANNIISNKKDNQYYLTNNGVWNNGEVVSSLNSSNLVSFLNNNNAILEYLNFDNNYVINNSRRIISIKTLKQKVINFINKKNNVNINLNDLNLVNFATKETSNPWLIKNSLFINWENINWFSSAKPLHILPLSKVQLLKF